MTEPTLSPCAGIVRRHDNDRFLTALFAPAEGREDLFALYAFNHEVAKTREVVSEPTLGLIRLQWWRESLDGAFAGTPRRHEVVEPMAAAIKRRGLDRRQLETLIDAREADLEEEGNASLDCLVNYADVTGTPLVRLALAVLGVEAAAAEGAARAVGTAYALTGILRAVPFHASQGRILLPRDRLAAAGVTELGLLDGRPEPGLRTVVAEVAERARGPLAEARRQRSAVPREALPALLPASLAELYLGTLAKAGHDPFAARVQMVNPFRQIRLAWAALTGRW